jgi:hypothetical protein
MGSYNYLGFAQTEGPCAQQTAEATSRYGCGVCSSQHELGNTYAILCYICFTSACGLHLEENNTNWNMKIFSINTKIIHHDNILQNGW